jgi:iron complex outermembrane receptor protein
MAKRLRPPRSRTYGLAVTGAIFAVSSANLTDARAQTQLPGIVVTTPSPIKRPAPTRPTTPAVSAPAPAPPTAPTPAPEPELEPIAGTSLQIPSDPSFAAVTVLTPKEILSQPYAQLGDSLALKPGIASTSFAPGSSRPIIRGLSGFRVGITENGIATGDASALSDDHAIPLDPNSQRQVEVVRGPATLRYGSQAIGGVVNAINTRIPEVVPPNGFIVETQGGLSSVDEGYNGNALVEAGAGNVVVHADAFRRNSNDYAIPGGIQPNTSVDSEGFSLGSSYVFSKGFVGVAFTSFDSTYFIPGIEAAAEKNHIVLNQTKWTSRGEWRVNDMGLEAIRFAFGAIDYKHDEVDGLGADAVIGATFLNKQYEARIEAQLQPIQTGLGELRSAIGTQWFDRDISAAEADGIILPPSHTQSIAAFIFEELQLSRKLRFQAAARIESNVVDSTASTFPANFLPPPDDPDQTPASKTFLPISVSLGFLYDLPYGVVARLTGQHVERAPDATELFYRGPHDSTQTFEIGTPGLGIEQANAVEIGFTRARGDFRFDVSAYYTEFKDFIFKRFTGAKCDEDFASCAIGGTGGLDQIVYSQLDATFVGAELLAEQDIGRIWRGIWGVDAQYDFVRATFSDGTFVPKMPPHRLGAGIYYRDANWFARLNLLHAFAQNEFAAFDTPTPGYNQLNAELSYTVKANQQAFGAPEMTIGVRGENLLNDDIRYSTSFKKDEVLQPGTNVRLFGIIKLN